MTDSDGPSHLTLEEAAKALRKSRQTLYQREWKQRLRMVKVGGHLLVPAEAVHRLLSGEGDTQPGPPAWEAGIQPPSVR